jgi:hypothetical protein
MPSHDQDPKTRQEKKGRKDKGPYSAKHVRAYEALVAVRLTAGPTAVPTAGPSKGPKAKK